MYAEVGMVNQMSEESDRKCSRNQTNYSQSARGIRSKSMIILAEFVSVGFLINISWKPKMGFLKCSFCSSKTTPRLWVVSVDIDPCGKEFVVVWSFWATTEVHKHQGCEWLTQELQNYIIRPLAQHLSLSTRWSLTTLAK